MVLTRFSNSTWAPMAFRIALFAAAASLAAYIPYKYATQLHAIQGLYAFLFPLSAILAAAGITLAVRPKTGCDCSKMVRSGVGAVAVLWLATGVLCVGSLVGAVEERPASGLFATFHMVAQHVFLSLTVIAFAFAPRAMARLMGSPMPDSTQKDSEKGGLLHAG